jgi:DNA topoisomerase-1
MSQSLIIVESPAKARTLQKYLGKNFTVKASVGHIIDLPVKTLGVDVANDFAPQYVTIRGKGKIISDLKSAAEKADKIYLAPDPDREGEAIAHHIAEILQATHKPIHRVLFHELTKKAILTAIEQATEVNQQRFEAQQTRRILDRLVGYQISPLLWDKVRRGLSAGRVQSVAVRMVCEREQAIEAFVSEEYWSIHTTLEGKTPPPFVAQLDQAYGKKIDLKKRSAPMPRRGPLSKRCGTPLFRWRASKRKRRNATRAPPSSPAPCRWTPTASSVFPRKKP